ncbi:cytochrome C biogenesis protein ResB [Geobacter sp. FeAm09]|uniref:cytochrome C biogenesis protein ResB n=1 Tax=Geobacter sp. FeAm09 TaxID=2597769 RepID=UPI0011EF7E26|nr:cytochrome C biogenesis protein ResB [Geobacter sp. FeAm09]QEM68001.1 cytochrome C biogenesis protein ResB [Geobacter sp. FeAm09]
MKSFWRLCISLELCLVLLAAVCGAMAAGSFRLSGEYAAAINAMPLLAWLRRAPFPVSWWLWLCLALLALLAVNTVFCSIATVGARRGRAGLVPLLAPQMLHAGFLLIMIAHLLSATGGFMEQVVAFEGDVIRLPDGRPFAIGSIGVIMSPQGMPTGISSELFTAPNDAAARVTITPNHPWLSGGYGVYLKQAEAVPHRRALLEIHREPGAAAALAGALLFMAGNILLLYLRNGAREAAPEADP